MRKACLNYEQATHPVYWLATLIAVPLGMDLNPVEDMDVCKCIVPSLHGGTLNCHRAASPLVGLVEGEERWVAPSHLQGVLPQNWGGTQENRSVTYRVLKAKDNDRRKNLAFHRDEFRGSCSDVTVDRVI
ncbi:uncharacterized protein TNCV_4092891 [Trichonephila clavipes]|nr:uncharacterized protein TNCV_4092891 [Trichonephila clavipes]